MVGNRILLVDDDAQVSQAYARVLASRGWAVETAADAKEAVEHLRRGSFDAIVSDVCMPGMSGLEFLRAVRAYDLDVPVILITGEPGLDSAIQAIEYGAFRYLLKPVESQLLQETVRHAVRFHDMARLRRDASVFGGGELRRIGDRAGLDARFTMALKLFWMAYQPVVSLSGRSVLGYEALLRSYEPTLPGADDVLRAAERTGRVHELGRAIRARIVGDAEKLPGDAKLFVNLHALDLNDDELYAQGSPLSRIAPRVVLEITERASLEGVRHVALRVKTLRSMGFQIAVDDLGAGYAGLNSYSQLEPDIVKIDIVMVKGIDSDLRKQSIVRSMKKLFDELHTSVVAEGVETSAERDTLADLGFDLLQGYFFAKPDHGFPMPHFAPAGPRPPTEPTTFGLGGLH